MHGLVNVGDIAERNARRIVSQVTRLVRKLVHSRNTRRLNYATKLERFFQFDHNNIVVVRARVEFLMLNKKRKQI